LGSVCDACWRRGNLVLVVSSNTNRSVEVFDTFTLDHIFGGKLDVSLLTLSCVCTSLLDLVVGHWGFRGPWGKNLAFHMVVSVLPPFLSKSPTLLA
jgi:hypothetical protein